MLSNEWFVGECLNCKAFHTNENDDKNRGEISSIKYYSFGTEIIECKYCGSKLYSLSENVQLKLF